MSQSLHSIIQRRQVALIRAWVADPLIQVQAESPAQLARLVFLDDPGVVPAGIPLGRRRSTNVAMVRRDGDPDINCSLWVAASFTGYRSAYVSFIREAYNLNAQLPDLAGYDVDHLLNRARAPLDSTFIRIEAVPAATNQEWGRLFEKTSSNPAFLANTQRQRRTMSYMICAKLAGWAPPRGPSDEAGIDRLAALFMSRGLRESEARSGLASMLEFAYSLR